MNILIDTIRTTPTTNKTVVAVSDCYSIKDQLKAAGFSWSPMYKRWEKVTADALEAITELLVKFGTVEDYESLYARGVLDENNDFTDEQYNRIAEAIGE